MENGKQYWQRHLLYHNDSVKQVDMAEIKYKNKQVVNVLIIDDHKMIRDGLKVMLTSLHKSIHFKVLEAESGEDAMIKISHNRFEVIIIDYQMPGLLGTETIYCISTVGS
jgi:CheY-like chemotaxis protein